MLQPERSRTREAQHHCFAPSRTQPSDLRLADEFGAVPVSENKAGVRGDNVAWKVCGNGEIKPVAIVEVLMPFSVRTVIGETGLDLDDHNLASGREPHNVGAPTVPKWKFSDHGVPMSPQCSADTALKSSGCL